MDVDLQQLGARLRQARDQAGISQDDAAQVLGISQPTYSRIEGGERALKGDELIVLADLFGVRAAAITGIAAVQLRARSAARTDGSASPMTVLSERLYAYLELDGYLNDLGIADP